MSTPCDIIADNAQRTMVELDKMVTRVQRAQNTVNSVLNSATDYIGQAASVLPDPSSLPGVGDIDNMLANIAASCPQLDIDDIEGVLSFASELQESYQSLIRSTMRDPLQSMKSLQDNLQRQFQSQGINDKLARFQDWLDCIESLCGSLDGFAPGKGNTASEISNYYNTNLAINGDGQPQILSDTVQSQVTDFESTVSGLNDYIDSLSLLGV